MHVPIGLCAARASSPTSRRTGRRRRECARMQPRRASPDEGGGAMGRCSTLSNFKTFLDEESASLPLIGSITSQNDIVHGQGPAPRTAGGGGASSDRRRSGSSSAHLALASCSDQAASSPPSSDDSNQRYQQQMRSAAKKAIAGSASISDRFQSALSQEPSLVAAGPQGGRNVNEKRERGSPLAAAAAAAHGGGAEGDAPLEGGGGDGSGDGGGGGGLSDGRHTRYKGTEMHLVFGHSEESEAENARPHGEGRSRVMSAVAPPREALCIRRIGEYDLVKTIGSGSTGKVKLAVHRRSGEQVAVKIVPRRQLEGKRRSSKETTASRERRILREAAILNLINHENIVKLKDFLITADYFCMFFEFVDGVQLLDYIVSHGKLEESQARAFFRQILSAVDYCHHNSIVHRDLKIENILVERGSQARIKLLDFGLSNFFHPDAHLDTFCGSLYFAAPELLSGHIYTGPEVDVWSLGIVLYVLVCGRVPFDDKSLAALHEKIKTCNLTVPERVSVPCRELLFRMICKAPECRATMDEVIFHTWTNIGHATVPAYIALERLPLDTVDETVLALLDQEFGIQYSKEQMRSVLEGATIDWASAFRHPIVSLYFLAKDKIFATRDARLGYKAPLVIDASERSRSFSHFSRTHHNGLPALGDAPIEGRALPAAPHEAAYRRGPSPLSSTRRKMSAPAGPGSPLGHGVAHLTSIGGAGPSSPPSAGGRRQRGGHRAGGPEHVIFDGSDYSGDGIDGGQGKSPLEEEDSRLTSYFRRLSMGGGAREHQAVKAGSARRKGKSRSMSEAQNITITSDTQDSYLGIKTVYIKGLFNVNTTSNKPPMVIRNIIQQCLLLNGIQFDDHGSYFTCSYNDRFSMAADTVPPSGDGAGPPPVTDPIAIRGGAPRRTAAAAAADRSREEGGGHAGGDRAQVNFEVHIVRIALLALYGVQFKRISGDGHLYKAISSQIIGGIKL